MVVQAAWKKYPNPMSPSVIALDVIDRKVSPAGSLYTHRLMTTEWGLPNWVVRVGSGLQQASNSNLSESLTRIKTAFIRLVF